jgi:anti-sigma regulatory factor (Ser/Thr protein kinase)
MTPGSEPTGPCLFIRVPSQTRFLAVERALVRQVGLLAGFPPETVDRIVLAIDEACTNIIRHGYGGPCDRPIEIGVELLGAAGDGQPAGVTFVIRDYGRQVDPAKLVPRDVGEVRPGGLGVHIIHQVMDKVEYSRAEGAGMKLTLTKRHNACGPGNGPDPAAKT